MRIKYSVVVWFILQLYVTAYELSEDNALVGEVENIFTNLLQNGDLYDVKEDGELPSNTNQIDKLHAGGQMVKYDTSLSEKKKPLWFRKKDLGAKTPKQYGGKTKELRNLGNYGGTAKDLKKVIPEL